MRRLAVAFLLIVAAACGSDKSTGPKRIEGTYTMQSIDSQTLPMIYYDDPAAGQRVEVLSGSITLSSNGTYSSPWSLRITDAGTVSPYSETCTGTYTRSGNSITMNETDNNGFCGGVFNADWDGNNTLTEEGSVVYRR
ncbi:MAG: hypothetical protein ACJ79K_02580 [Gemmatimonadaceae bacterium]